MWHSTLACWNFHGIYGNAIEYKQVEEVIHFYLPLFQANNSAIFMRLCKVENPFCIIQNIIFHLIMKK